jgi:hypothetical protein
MFAYAAWRLAFIVEVPSSRISIASKQVSA